MLGVQVFSALRDLYGRDGAETISGLCGTRVVLAAPDRDTSEWSAESLGRVEVEALAEGVSYDTPRDGVTLSARRDLRSLVLPAEVARLENLSGYLKFPGAWPVARIRLKYKNRAKVAERFEARADGEGVSGSGVRNTGGRCSGYGRRRESGRRWRGLAMVVLPKPLDETRDGSPDSETQPETNGGDGAPAGVDDTAERPGGEATPEESDESGTASAIGGGPGLPGSVECG